MSQNNPLFISLLCLYVIEFVVLSNPFFYCMLKPSISDFNLGYIQWWCEEESLENHGNIIDILHYTIFPNHRRKRVNISKRKSHAHTSHINRLILVCFDLCRYTSSLNVDIEYDIMVLLYGLRHGHTLDEHARQLMDDHIIKNRLEKINFDVQVKTVRVSHNCAFTCAWQTMW